MNQETTGNSSRPPWHLWLIGLLALAWNSAGAFDYFMTKTRNAAYLASFTPEQLAYFESFPAWVVATWALGVWGGVLGSILLLLRRRVAVPVFAASLAAMAVTFFYNYALTNGFQVMGGAGALAFSVAIFVVGAALLAYARKLALSGVVR